MKITFKQLSLLVFLAMASLAQGQQLVNVNLWMWTTGHHSLWDGQDIEFYGFSVGFSTPVLPGPTLHVNEGDTMEILLRNQSQGAPHTIHLHGLDVDQANDGVPQTSFVLEHGQDTVYRFVASHAGTYLYHCHVATVLHVQLGMYGSIVVHAAGGSQNAWTSGPAYDRDYLWLMSEVDTAWFNNIPVHFSNDTLHETFSVPPYRPDYFLINGLSNQQLDNPQTKIRGAPSGDIYLRLSNIGYFQNRVIFPSALNATVLASDGRPLPTSFQSDTVWVRPGERYGVMLSPVQELMDSVQVDYLNMSNLQLQGSQWVAVEIDSSFVGTAELNQDLTGFNLAPNPGHSELSLYWEQANRKVGKVEFYDPAGKLVLTKQIGSGLQSIKFDLPELGSGLYLVKASFGGRTGSRRWLKLD